MFVPLKHLRLSTLLDNAMFYKDITQWLRGRGFPSFFMGLLVTATIICGLIVLAAPEQGEGGPVAFGFLAGLLGIYTLIVGFTGYNLTAKEFQNRTFELYELCGMSLEKMVWGKLSSMLGQFLFGFFCIVPFLFVSYLMGGLDFIDIIAAVLIFMFTAPFFYLLMLLLSLAAEKLRIIRTLVHAGVYLFLGVILPWWGVLLISLFASRGTNPIEEILKLLLEGNAKALGGLCIFMLVYAQMLLLLFYSACHAISPTTDTRETPIKALAFTITFTVLAGVATANNLGSCLFLLYLMGGALCLFGLVFFYEPVEMPLMARKRMENAKGIFRRGWFFLFRATPWGTLRTIVLIWGSLLVFPLLTNNAHIYSTTGGFPGMELVPQAFGFVLSVPFYIFFPGFLLFQFRKLRHNLIYARALLFVWWGVGGVFLSIFYSIIHSSRVSDTLQNIFYLVSYLLSPISALVTREIHDGIGMKNALGIHTIMGAGGMFLLFLLCRSREKAARKDRESALSVTESRTPQNTESPA